MWTPVVPSPVGMGMEMWVKEGESRESKGEPSSEWYVTEKLLRKAVLKSSNGSALTIALRTKKSWITRTLAIPLESVMIEDDFMVEGGCHQIQCREVRIDTFIYLMVGDVMR